MTRGPAPDRSLPIAGPPLDATASIPAPWPSASKAPTHPPTGPPLDQHRAAPLTSSCRIVEVAQLPAICSNPPTGPPAGFPGLQDSSNDPNSLTITFPPVQGCCATIGLLACACLGLMVAAGAGGARRLVVVFCGSPRGRTVIPRR